jgi:hypothetical protein
LGKPNFVTCNICGLWQKHVFSLSLSLHRAGPAARSLYFDFRVKITFESAAQRDFCPRYLFFAFLSARLQYGEVSPLSAILLHLAD